MRAGLIRNPRSRRNRHAPAPLVPDGVLAATPETPLALAEALDAFARARIELLVVDGGDGTVREVLTQAPAAFGGDLPPLAVLPSGKTNALALDLRAPRGWRLEAALAAAQAGRRARRAPLELTRHGQAEPFARGFIFGAGAFVHATELAQSTHRVGAFGGLAIGMTLAGAAMSTLFGSGWRAGEPMRLDWAGAEPHPIFLLMASTLERLPLGLKPFGPPQPGLKTLAVDAPPRGLAVALAPLLTGRNPGWLARAGYARAVRPAFDVDLPSRFILDGETFEGGALNVREGATLEFVVP